VDLVPDVGVVGPLWVDLPGLRQRPPRALPGDGAGRRVRRIHEVRILPALSDERELAGRTVGQRDGIDVVRIALVVERARVRGQDGSVGITDLRLCLERGEGAEGEW